MPLGTIGLLDLSIITDRLIALLEDARDNSPLWEGGSPPFDIEVTGAAPDVTRSGSGCVVNLYLFHIGANKFVRNSPLPHHLPPGTPEPAALRVPRIPFHPLGLDLYYLLTAWAEQRYVQEQKAMSIALKCFHENPIVRTTVTLEGTPVPEEFTLTMEVQTADELGRLWQSVTSPARLATVYKVSVVFLAPEAAGPLAPPPKSVGVGIAASDFLGGDLPSLLGSRRTVAFRSPQTTGVPQPDIRTFDLTPAVAGPGESFALLGSALASPLAQRVFLLDGTTEHDITAAWHPTAANDTSSRIVLTLPGTVGALPANAPQAGVYQVRVGDGTQRSNATPFSVSARVDPPAAGALPFLTPAGDDFSLAGAGFVPGETEVLVGGHLLTESAGAPAAGEFSIGGGGTALQFRLPAGLPDGTYEVRVRVRGVDSPPAWWVRLP